MQLLIDNGAEIDLQTKDGTCALHNAVSKGRGRAIVLLVGAGANPNLQEARGLTSLHFAAAHEGERPDIVKYLLEHGADPFIVDRQGNPALFYAVENAYAEVAQLLLHARLGG